MSKNVSGVKYERLHSSIALSAIAIEQRIERERGMQARKRRGNLILPLFYFSYHNFHI